MSTSRRTLGTGPTSTRTTATQAPAPRLLPVERIEHGEHQDHGEDAARPVPRGRRSLGLGHGGEDQEHDVDR